MKFFEALESIKYEDVINDDGSRWGPASTRYWDIARIWYDGLNGEFNTSNGDIWFIQQGEEGLGGYHYTNNLPRLPISDYTERDDWHVVKR